MRNNQSQPPKVQSNRSASYKGAHGPRSGSRNGGPGNATISAITAPYNFVPLSSWVHIPEWSAAVSHDLPFEDGLCGELGISLTAETPILIGGEKTAGSTAVHPYALPDGRHAIPGASLKGMLRNVLEIATFGRMASVDDQQFALRDLSGPTRNDYQKKFASTILAPDVDNNKPKAYVALSEAGWLQYRDGTWTITPCDVARVDHKVLDDLLRPKDAPPNTGGPFRQIAESKSREAEGGSDETNPKLPLVKYREFIRAVGHKLSKEPAWKWLTVHFEMDAKPLSHPHSNDKHLYYRRVTRVGTGSSVGRLVFTGQPGPKKHMEFVFHDPSPAREPEPVPESVMRAFLALHNPASESNSGRRPPASVVWDFHRRERIYGNKGIPVFFLRENGRIASLGLSQMYRLPYKLTLGQAIANTQKQPRWDQADFCDALFGHAAAKAEDGLRSRVSFGHAVAIGSPRPVAFENTILSGPKASFFPNYIVQKDAHADGTRLKDGGHYTTLMDEKAEIRGWKRYPVRGACTPQKPSAAQSGNQAIQTRLHPLPAGTVFEGRVRFHNLLPEELGALVWALTWGGDDRCRHAMGMGKPFGMGQVRIDITACRIMSNKPGASPPSEAECLERFVAHMEAAHAAHAGRKPWCAAPQIRALLAMANPEAGRNRPLKHLTLDGRNEFAEAKKAGLVLPGYLTGTGDAP